jgi:hypothetical protein
MRNAFVGIGALAIVIAAGAAASAHHSHPAFYDGCTSVTIDGRIDSVQWKNPHALLDITTEDGKAYRAEWGPPNALRRDNITEPAVGERVVVVGNPMRDIAAIKATFPALNLEPPTKPVLDVVQIRGVTGNWQWSRPAATTQGCRK